MIPAVFDCDTLPREEQLAQNASAGAAALTQCEVPFLWSGREVKQKPTGHDRLLHEEPLCLLHCVRHGAGGEVHQEGQLRPAVHHRPGHQV